jgi:hypothetical protein
MWTQENTRKFAKRMASKAARRAAKAGLLAGGGDYKVVYCSYRIRDLKGRPLGSVEFLLMDIKLLHRYCSK